MKIKFIIGAAFMLIAASCTKEIATTEIEKNEGVTSAGGLDTLTLDFSQMNNYIDGTYKNWSYVNSDSSSNDLRCFIDLEFDSNGVYWFTTDNAWESFLNSNGLQYVINELNNAKEISDTLISWEEDAYFLENDSFTTAFNDLFESFYGYRYDDENNFTPKAGLLGKYYDDINYQNLLATFYGSRPNFGNASNKTESFFEVMTCASIHFDDRWFRKPILYLTVGNGLFVGSITIQISNLGNSLKNKFESKLFPC